MGRGKNKKIRHPQYIVQYFALIFCVIAVGSLIYLWIDYRQFKERIEQDFEELQQTIEAIGILSEDGTVIQTFSSSGNSENSEGNSLEGALSVMQGQYSAYSGQISRPS